MPPGLFGYDADYRNPFRRLDLDARRRSSREAGYPDGVDPATGKRLHLTFDTGDTTRTGPPALPVLRATRGAGSGSTSRSRPPPTTSSRTRCAAAPTRSSSGAGSPTIPTRRTSCSCCGARWRAAERRPEHRQLLRRGVRPALPATCGTCRTTPSGRGDRRDARHPGARAALDRALPSGGLHAVPRLAAQLEAARHVVRRPSSTTTSTPPCGACGGRSGTGRPVGRSSSWCWRPCCSSRRRSGRAGRRR